MLGPPSSVSSVSSRPSSCAESVTEVEGEAGGRSVVGEKMGGEEDKGEEEEEGTAEGKDEEKAEGEG